MVTSQGIERAERFESILVLAYNDLLECGLEERAAGVKGFYDELTRNRIFGLTQGRLVRDLNEDGSPRIMVDLDDGDIAEVISHASAYLGIPRIIT